MSTWLTQVTAATGLRVGLLDATVRLLHSRGVAGLTTRDIAREAGLLGRGAVPTLTSLRKADLFVAVAQEARLRPDFGDLVSRVGASTVERNLEHIILSTKRFMTELVPIVTEVAANSELRAGWAARSTVTTFRRVEHLPRSPVHAANNALAVLQAGVAVDVREHARRYLL